MKYVVSFEDTEDTDAIGGKALSLSRMVRDGLNIPPGICITTRAYSTFIHETGLSEMIALELSRKEEMRWEELWDSSLRIRNLFARTTIPRSVLYEILPLIEKTFAGKRVAVRSSAPGEDTGTSFAGLHESFLNITGTDSIIEHVKKVWASLFSDGALLYRQELGIDAQQSTMAVVIQSLVPGTRSGVVFGKNPMDATQSVIEAVWGLNQGLVDGTVEPDRWILDRRSGSIIEHSPSGREKQVLCVAGGTSTFPLPEEKRRTPPLADEDVLRVFSVEQETEEIFGEPLDMEWTFAEGELYTLQARPITAQKAEPDPKAWYLGLSRSFENLKVLHTRIVEELIPGMQASAIKSSHVDLSSIDDSSLARELLSRNGEYLRWKDLYWRDFIPFAHGMRLFGQVYNDMVKPEDPYEFMELLTGENLSSLRRNALLEEMACLVRESPDLRRNLEKGQAQDREFSLKLEEFMNMFGDLSCFGSRCTRGIEGIGRIILGMAEMPRRESTYRGREKKQESFLDLFSEERRDFAKELLEIARESYRLRDDDNIHLGRVEAQRRIAIEEAKQRIRSERGHRLDTDDPEELCRMLENPDYLPVHEHTRPRDDDIPELRGRQLVGQPAGRGVCTGPAHIIDASSDLAAFRRGEVLVCDAIDPAMTFVVPLASGIVERRGGMLIHGAIIAREYGIPCVTGVSHATRLISDGDELTVDGFLGIVIIG